jgi:hypothetical protein
MAAGSHGAADRRFVLRFMDILTVDVRAGDHFGHFYMLSFDYAPAGGTHLYSEYDVHLAATQPNVVAIESFD